MRGAGDLIEAGLSAVGITKQRVQAIASAVGIADCGCNGRQEFLNKLIPFGKTENPKATQFVFANATEQTQQQMQQVAKRFRGPIEPLAFLGTWEEAANSERVAEWFVAMNPDTILQEHETRQTLQRRRPPNTEPTDSERQTLYELQVSGFPAERHDNTAPLLMHRDNLRKLFVMFPIEENDLQIGTLYVNVYGFAAQ